MKTYLFAVGIFFTSSLVVMGQNYMGKSQYEVLESLGEPDSIGNSYLIYSDLHEKGNNIYRFDEKGNCTSFEIVRNISYLNEYQRMLNREFKSAGKNKYIKKTKKADFMAELILSDKTFQIKVRDGIDLSLVEKYPMIVEVSSN